MEKPGTPAEPARPDPPPTTTTPNKQPEPRSITHVGGSRLRLGRGCRSGGTATAIPTGWTQPTWCRPQPWSRSPDSSGGGGEAALLRGEPADVVASAVGDPVNGVALLEQGHGLLGGPVPARRRGLGDLDGAKPLVLLPGRHAVTVEPRYRRGRPATGGLSVAWALPSGGNPVVARPVRLRLSGEPVFEVGENLLDGTVGVDDRPEQGQVGLDRRPALGDPGSEAVPAGAGGPPGEDHR